MPFVRLAACGSFLLVLMACSLAPQYSRPQSPVPPDFGQEASSELALPAWQDFFREPRLRALIETSLAENRDLRLAVLNIEAARASMGLARADRLPSLEAMGEKNISGGPERATVRSYELGLTSMWDLDFFGRLRNLSEAAREQYLAAAQGARAARLSLVAQAAEAYLETRLAEEELALTRRTLANWRSSQAFMEERIISGQGTLLDLEQARSQSALAETVLADNEASLKRAENALRLLIGRQDTLTLPPPWTLVRWEPAELPANVRSEVLLRRPDILEAEHRLKAAQADIGAARAAFFPSLSLTGTFGWMSGELNTLVSPAAAGWSFVPRLTLPIFAGGRNRANLELAEVRSSQAVAAYEKAIQTAFREAADALGVRPLLARQYQGQRQYLAIRRRVLELAQNRYQSGTVSYLEVLEAQREVFEAERNLLAVRRSQLLNEIRLYLALGGGLDDGPRAPGEEPNPDGETA
ncbi:MAG: efflux transporter outer membrane subunit [Deltaproteobacteria bacterium]|jgi:Cu(I)/Ag(I) efflux system outer membrane protein|nr:efflux transporter outer membrane subunit [Deltaproteobacteria bacterium]